MKCHQWIALLALVALVAGCAGPGASIGSSASGENGSALTARDFTGTWHGSYQDLGIGNSYDEEADCTLRISEDATFTVTCTRDTTGTNNLARGSSWSGTVVTKGHEIVLHDNGGEWPSIVLRRSHNGTLYGTTVDPLVGATVEMEFERESHPSASPGGN